MDRRPRFDPDQAHLADAGSGVLDSWKEISAYLQRDVRTLQRWERERQLPIRRMPGGAKPGVFALKSELDQWRGGSSIHLASPGLGQPAAVNPAVAVLPFLSLSGAKEDEYFADGLADEIITELARIPGLNVTARTSSFAFRGKERDICGIGKSLRAGAVLEGSVRREKNRLRVTAQLVETTKGYHLWGDRFDRPVSGLFQMQDEIAQAIVDTLRIRLEAGRRPVREHNPRQDAYSLYLRGRHKSLRQDPHSLLESRLCYEQAASLDPDFAQAHLGIAESWWECALFGLESPREAVAIGRTAIRRALELCDALGEAHAMLGVYQAVHDFQWTDAARTFSTAMVLSPSSTPVLLRHAAYLLEPTGCLQEAETEFRRALDLDPLSPVALTYLGQCLMFQKRYDEAIALLREALEIDPDYWLANFVLGGTFLFTGRIAEAVQIGERAMAAVGPNPTVLGAMGAALAMIGETRRAMQMRDQLKEISRSRYVSPLSLAWIHFGANQMEECLDQLEAAVDEREPQFIHFPIKPMYDPFRTHPRFQTLIARMGLGQ